MYIWIRFPNYKSKEKLSVFDCSLKKRIRKVNAEGVAGLDRLGGSGLDRLGSPGLDGTGGSGLDRPEGFGLDGRQPPARG